MKFYEIPYSPMQLHTIETQIRREFNSISQNSIQSQTIPKNIKESQIPGREHQGILDSNKSQWISKNICQNTKQCEALRWMATAAKKTPLVWAAFLCFADTRCAILTILQPDSWVCPGKSLEGYVGGWRQRSKAELGAKLLATHRPPLHRCLNNPLLSNFPSFFCPLLIWELCKGMFYREMFEHSSILRKKYWSGIRKAALGQVFMLVSLIFIFWVHIVHAIIVSTKP